MLALVVVVNKVFLDMMIIIMVVAIFAGFFVAAQKADKRESEFRQKQKDKIKELERDNEKLGGLINDLCKSHDIPLEDFKQLREKHGV